MSPQLFALRKARAMWLAESLSEETGIPIADILGDTRDPGVVAVRHRLWTILYDSGLSYPTIGRLLGRDHTTIRAGIRKTFAQQVERAERAKGAA